MYAHYLRGDSNKTGANGQEVQVARLDEQLERVERAHHAQIVAHEESIDLEAGARERKPARDE